MATMSQSGVEALNRLRTTDPPVWLAPSQELAQAARVASGHLFSSLKPYSPKSPFDQLLIDGFDAEQIWQQIDLQSQPLLSSLRREVKKFEKNPEEISKLRDFVEEKQTQVLGANDDEDMEMDIEHLGGGGGGDDDDEDNDDDDEEEEEDDEDDDEGKQKGEKDNEGEEGAEEEEEESGGGIEDKFLKIKELQEYLEEGEAEEFGLDSKKKKKGSHKEKEKGPDDDDGDDEDEEDDEDEDEEEDDEMGAFGNEDDEDDNDLENARYEDFFGAKKKVPIRKTTDLSEEEEDDEEGKANLSTHEKELKNLQSKIEQMEKANMDAKDWTMQGEVTAAKRPKNSALEVDLDFEHNVRPAPVITEEVTASLEDLIKNRILEGNFNDVQRAPALPTKSPREVKELDDNKSKKGLAEVYEEEYVRNTNPAFAPTPFSDELKKEASMLFKKLCLKLDALSHFHFTPKPVIEDMSIQANVPALAMEEIAPLAVSDAAMLAPEEIFVGKGDIKEETELTKAERKRRRANKKRRFRAGSATRMASKAQIDTVLSQKNGDVQ